MLKNPKKKGKKNVLGEIMNANQLDQIEVNNDI